MLRTFFSLVFLTLLACSGLYAQASDYVGSVQVGICAKEQLKDQTFAIPVNSVETSQPATPAKVSCRAGTTQAAAQLVSNTEVGSQASCDPSQCTPQNCNPTACKAAGCDPKDCDPAQCDLSKCTSSGAEAGAVSKPATCQPSQCAATKAG